MSTDTVTQRLRDTQIQEYRYPEARLHWITEVQEYAKTWGCKDIETHTHTLEQRGSWEARHRYAQTLVYMQILGDM